MIPHRLARLAVAILWALVGAGCGTAPATPAAAPRQTPLRLPSVETIQARRGILPLKIELIATIEPLYKTDLCARIAGTLDRVPRDLDIGREVDEAEELLRLAVPDLEAQKRHREEFVDLALSQRKLAEAARNVAEKEVAEVEQQCKRFAADVEYRQLTVQRLRQLVERNAVQPERLQEEERQLQAAEAALEAAKAQVETRRARLLAATAELEVAQARVDLAERDLETTRTMIALASIRSPFSGVITKRWLDRGAQIKDAGTPIFTIMHLDTVRVLFDIPERYVPYVDALLSRSRDQDLAKAKLDPVILHVPSLRDQKNGGIYRGTITLRSESLDPVTRTMRTEMHIDNPNRLLKPGMFGQAILHLDERYNALTVPSSALLRRNGRTEVLVLDGTGPHGEGKVKAVPVELGLDDGKRVEIRSGLTGQERILLRGNGMVQEGETVIGLPVAD